LTLCPEHRQRLTALVDRDITLGVRPEALGPSAARDVGTALRVRVDVVEPLGERMDVLASTDRHERIVCRIDARESVREGEIVDMQVDMNRVHFFASDGVGRNVSLPADTPSG